VSYCEREVGIPGAVAWSVDVPAGAKRQRILPDGCLDVIWDGRRLFVAGPDRRVRWHPSVPGTRFVGLRFSGGVGPQLVGTPADHLRDRTVDLADLWSQRKARILAEQVAADPDRALASWARSAAAESPLDSFGGRVVAALRAGLPPGEVADQLGIGSRQLHRRSLPAFGYGPRHLARVLRFQRAVDSASRGVPLAEVASHCGYADQAHLSREFRDLAGVTPRQLVGRSTPSAGR
jgi:AraC-like DNA-binding protein